MLGRLIGENVELLWHAGPIAGCVELDPGQVDQILTNLVVDHVLGQGVGGDADGHHSAGLVV